MAAVTLGVGDGNTWGDITTFVEDVIDKNHPANDACTLDTFKALVASDMAGFVLGIFRPVSGNTYQCVASQSIGTITAGAWRTFSISLACQSGDIYGWYSTSGQVYDETTGGAGIQHQSHSANTFTVGQQTAFTTILSTWKVNFILSGTSGGGGIKIPVVMHHLKMLEG